MNGTYVVYVINALITAVVGAMCVAVWLANRKRLAAETVGRAEEQAARLIKDAERDADSQKKEALLEAKERAHELLVEAERQARERRQQMSAVEQTLTRREEKLTERLAGIEQRERDARAQEQALAKREKSTAEAAARYEALVAEQHRELQRVAGLTGDEAKDVLLKQMEADARRDAANLVKRLEAEARETAAQRARQLITEAIQRSAAEHAVETTVSVVDLPSDDLKGRIIGREGRNIRALEIATGVDLIVDDTPGAIILSGLRSVPPRDRQAGHRAADRGRAHPPGPDRGSRREGEAGTRRGSAARGRGGRLRARAARPAPRGAEADGPAEVPHQLRPERAQPLQGSRVPGRHDGARARPADGRHRARGVPARHRQGHRPRDAGHAPRGRPRVPAPARRAAGRCSTRSPRTTWTSTGRRSKR